MLGHEELEREAELRVEQVMSNELFAVGPAESADRVIRYLLLLGLTGAPVLDDEGKPIGMLSLRDYLTRSGETVGERMTTPVVMIWAHASLSDAAELLGDTGHHRAIVVDEGGFAVGMLSTLDLVRALSGKPTPHRSVQAHFEEATGLVWTEDEPLDVEHVHDAPAGPGLFVLTEAGARLVWAEAAEDVRAKLTDLVLRQSARPSPLAHAIERGNLQFRAALEPDAIARERALSQLLRAES